MRVLLVSDEAPGPTGGTEAHLARLAAGLRAAGDEVELFTGEVHHRGAARVLDLWDPLARRALRRLAERFSPDVVHVHAFHRELSPSVLGAVPGAARVLTLHDWYLLGGREVPPDTAPLRAAKAAKAALARAVAARAVHWAIAPTAVVAEAMRRAGFPRVEVVPHFAEAGPEPTSPPSAHAAVAFVGRLHAQKGVDVLARAFEALARRHPGARLLVAGDGPARGLLEELAAAHPGRVDLLGPLGADGVRRTMESARVVAVPSVFRETSGLVVLEAALAGRPVVTSDDPALRELVDEARCGLVVPRGDAAALEGALARLIDDPALADRLGAAGRAHAAATRDVSRGLARTREVYGRALALARAGTGRAAGG
jgi:glycosyltransferase involved in cell wall biosynthesis